MSRAASGRTLSEGPRNNTDTRPSFESQSIRCRMSTSPNKIKISGPRMRPNETSVAL